MKTRACNREKWLTVAEAAERYGVNPRTVMRMAETGEVKRRRYPHRRPAVFYSAADLSAALEVVEA